MSSYGDSDRWDGVGLGPTLAYPRLSLDGGFCPSILRTENRDTYMYISVEYIRSIHICMHRGCILEQMRREFVVDAFRGMAIQ